MEQTKSFFLNPSAKLRGIRERDANSMRFSRIKKLHLFGSRDGAAPRMPNEHKSYEKA
jgi:hypothetical protein